MTTTISAPTSTPSNLSPDHSPSPTSKLLSATLDTQIARLNSQIATLRQEKQSLSSALLASSAVQNIVKSRKTKKPAIADEEVNDVYRRLEEVVAKQQASNDITFHRLMNNVTSFPYVDPAPDRVRDGGGSMLGLRFEMPYTRPFNPQKSDGQDHSNGNDIDTDSATERIYLVVLDRMTRNGKTYLSFQPHMNQIPKHIDVEGFAAQYLPLPDADNDDGGNRRSPSVPESESFQDDSGIDVTQDLTHMVNGTNGHTAITGNQPPRSTQPPTPPITITNTNQSLPLFVSTTRNALLSWHYRKSHINHLVTSLTISPSPTPPPTYHFSITKITIDPSASHLSIDWINGHIGVLGINNHGTVEIARVFGPRIGRDDEAYGGDGDGDGDGDGGTFQCHGVERRLEKVGLGELVGRLQEISGLMGGGGGGGG